MGPKSDPHPHGFGYIKIKKKLLPPRPKPRSPSRSGHLSHNLLQWAERIFKGAFHILAMYYFSRNCSKEDPCLQLPAVKKTSFLVQLDFFPSHFIIALVVHY